MDAEITAHYRLSDRLEGSPSFLAEDCVSILVTGQGFHQTVSYELTCSPNLLFASADAGAQSGEITILQPFPPELFSDPYELEQTGAVLSGSVEVAFFGQLDLEQPAPVCRPTVLGFTLRNVTQRPSRHGGRSVYHTYELPFHAKYPAPVDGGEGCADDHLLRLSPGPLRRVQWLPPLLLLRTAEPREATGAASDEVAEGPAEMAPEPDAGWEAVAAEGEAPGDGASTEVLLEQQQELQQGPRQRPPGEPQEQDRVSSSARPWCVMRVQLQLPEVVKVPTGCMSHASWVSAATLVAALLCSTAMVAAALC